jgi:low affinity Fe/Cu permease
MNEKAAKRADQTPRSFRCQVNDLFRAFSRNTASAVGSAWAFIIAISIVIVWGATGPMFHFSDTWQLIINTGTTIVTFLMVFLIQNTQNRDGKAIQLKLDELIRALKGARNKLVDLEDLSEEELKKLEKEFQGLHRRSQEIETQVVKTES